MIVSGTKSDIQRPKSTQRGVVNAWCLKLKDSSDNPILNNKIQILYQQNQEQNQQNQNDQLGRQKVKSQGNSRNSSNIRQNTNQIYKLNEQQQISQQLSTRDYNSPIKTQACNNNYNIASDLSIQQSQLQKQKRPPSQLMHILQNQKKNIRQMFALQLSNNIQQDDKNKIQMQEIKEKLLRVSQERNKKINSLIFEENRNNQNVQNMINQNVVQQANSSQTQFRQKNNYQELSRNSQEFQDNKFKVFADYQSFLLNNNSNNNNSNNNNINYQIQNTYQTNSFRSQLGSQNSSTILTQSQQPKLKTILKNIPSQPALNRVIKQSLNQIQQAQNQEISQNIISVKRAQTREQFQNQCTNTERSIQRAQSMLCTKVIGQANSITTDQSGKVVFTCQNSIQDDNNSKITQQNQSQDKIEDELNFINFSSFTNILPSDTNDTPIQKNIVELKQIQSDENNENLYDEDTLQKRIRHISNPSLRKKYKLQSNLIMRNFLKKQNIPQINGKINNQNPSFFENNLLDTYTESNFVQFDGKSNTDQPKRKKNKKKLNQMSMGETCQSTEKGFIECLSNQNKNQTSSQSGQNVNFMSFSEFCNYQRQQQIFRNSLFNEQTNNTNLTIKKACSCSPSKKFHSYQISAIDQINNKQNQIFCKNCNVISPKIKQQCIVPQNQNITIKQTNQRPSTSLQRQSKDISSTQKVVTQKQSTSPDSENKQNRPGTAKLTNSQFQVNFNQINLINSSINSSSLNNAFSPSKNKFMRRVSSQIQESFFNVVDLNSWDNSRIEENSQFEMI
ncbi:hypothetical protein TTHERM_00332100 (macronuclear) [Tetrahymena thermophila SB210]|uniref:Uncharacterized protein n=1 Tax=Tetrahymena thermophila (strain SB210) TaxID=312017 RepID=I7MAX5_TETTS|nr:hypothetical protein TTHERM_00332100 [Tetrahymena thermophila SB210]EAS06332.1 hypothetical protein TTHERM_00332100 [Tetrahymena thermophila SB210]|eukprot:XP_001026577.1 hypothetical protein TTHERM_00332100 [Tetrahymena thermophila SB210]